MQGFRVIVSVLFTSILFISCTKENITNTTIGSLAPPVANAGSAQFLPAQATTATLSGTGTTTNGYITGYLWSLISGPNVPEIMTPSAATTVVNDLIAGSYLFQFAVIDSAGLTGIDTVSITIGQISSQTLTLTGTGDPFEFNFYGNDSADYGSGANSQVIAAAWTSTGSPVFVRGVLHFNLNSLPSGVTITSAKLSLFSPQDPEAGNLTTANFGTNNTFYIRKVANNWDPATADWLNQPSTSTTNEVLVPHTDDPFLDVPNIEIAALINDLRTSGNYGLMFQLQNETPFNIRHFCGSRYADASKHPKLVITYH